MGKIKDIVLKVNLLTSIKERGVKKVHLFVSDGFKGLGEICQNPSLLAFTNGARYISLAYLPFAVSRKHPT